MKAIDVATELKKFVTVLEANPDVNIPRAFLELRAAIQRLLREIKRVDSSVVEAERVSIAKAEGRRA